MPLLTAAKTTAFFGSDARLLISAFDGLINRFTAFREFVESSEISVIAFIDAGLYIPTISPCSQRTPGNKYVD